MATDWTAASKAYHSHHFNCAVCSAAGMAPGSRERCAEGAGLWRAYQLAGRPPHFKWKEVPPSKMPMRPNPPKPNRP